MNEQVGLLSRQLNDDIHQQFALGFANFPSDTRTFTQKSLEEVLKMTLPDRRLWLGRIRTARDFIENRSPEATALAELRRQRRFIATWLASHSD